MSNTNVSKTNTLASGRVKELLSWYRSENTGVLTNIARLLNSGTLAGTGKLVILPVDQGFEHGPTRSFAENPVGYNPSYHFELAIESGCNAYAAPYGQLAAGCSDYIGQIPMIVKANNCDTLWDTNNPIQSITCSVKEAARLGVTAIGFTIYPGSSARKSMFEEVREMIEEARDLGIPSVVWSYPRGEGLSKDGETAVDVVAYAAHIACQLGAHIVKVKPPTAHIEKDAAKKVFEKQKIKISTLAERVQHIVESCFGGKRIVIFSGGAAKGDAEVLDEIKGLAAGGAFGSIVGRNAFQRPRAEAVKLLKQIMTIYQG
jgi:class I fructose-bisphosphate aldolase